MKKRDDEDMANRFSLKKWEDVNYCEHSFYDNEEPLSDDEVVDLLNKQQNTILSLENEVERQKNEIKLLIKEYGKIPPKIREVWRD